VLSARPRSPSQQQRLGFSGSWSPNPSTLSNSYFKLLLEQDWKVGGDCCCSDKINDRHWCVWPAATDAEPLGVTITA
jgi:hypothetical protein